MQLTAKRILITGAGGGIGRRLIELLASRAARLGLLDRGPVAIKGLTELSAKLPGECIVAEADITNAEDRRHAVQAMNQAFGGVDVLVNLAGMLDFSPYEEADPGLIARLLQVNVEGPMLLTREVLPQMTAQRSGRIVNIGSMFGSIGFPCFTAYSASKFAMRGFSQALRRELSGSGVGVTYVSPRAVKTAFNPAVIHHMAEQGMMRMDEVDWVAQRIVKAIEQERDEAYLGFPESLFARINGVLPSAVDKSLNKRVPTLMGFARQER
jgi:short-subunit dehydrogenase